MLKVKELRPSKTLTLKRGWINPDTMEAHRVVVVRQQCIGDELEAERQLREFSRCAPGSEEYNLSKASTGEFILTTARCIISWEGLPAHTWKHVQMLTRTDYRMITEALAQLDEEGVEEVVAAAAFDEAQGTTDPK